MPLNSLLKRLGNKPSDPAASLEDSQAKARSVVALSQSASNANLSKPATKLPPVLQQKNKNLTEQEAEIKNLIE